MASNGQPRDPARQAPDSLDGPPDSGPERTCFIISPFGGYHERYIATVLEPAVRAADMRPQKASDLFRSSNIVDDIWEMITKASVVLVDMSGRNPNVFYELGLAHAAEKPAVLVTDDIDDVPFDLRSLRALVYDVKEPDWAMVLGSQITSALRETLTVPHNRVLPTFLNARPTPGEAVSPETKDLRRLQQELDSLSARVNTFDSRNRSDSRGADLSNLAQLLELDYDFVFEEASGFFKIRLGSDPLPAQNLDALRRWAIENDAWVELVRQDGFVVETMRP